MDHSPSPISDRARAFLREVKFAGGSIYIKDAGACQNAIACRAAGYVQITTDYKTAKITGHGQAHLDLLMRAH